MLAGWRMLLDDGRLQDGEPHLAGTAREPVTRMSAATAGEIGAADDDLVSVRTERGEITLPLLITDMPDGTVWLPLNSPGFGGTPAARRDNRSRRLDRAGTTMTYPDPTLFGHDPWWLVLAKALFIFVFLMLSPCWLRF